MTTTTTRILHVLVLASSWRALAAEPEHWGSTVTISVYDIARIGSKTLWRAEDLATRIFITGDIDARWTMANVSSATDLVSDFSPVTGNECAKPFQSAFVQVQILRHAPSGFAPQALASSLPCAQRGAQVSIYADRVELVSRGTLASFYRVLGYTLAHELGHVFLTSTAHDQSGLMKGMWSKGDWQRAAVAIIPFTADQGKRMTGRLDRSEPPAPERPYVLITILK